MAAARFAGSMPFFDAILGLAPQALCCRLLRELSEVARVSVIFLVISLHLFKGFCSNLTLYTVYVS